MIQIIPERRKSSTSEKFGEAIGAGMNSLAQSYVEHLMQQEQKKLEEEKYNQQIQALNQMTGMDFTGIRDPKILEKGFELAIQGRNKASQIEAQNLNKLSQLQGENELEQKNYETIKNTLGNKFADIWKAAPVGGKTELLKAGLEAKLRGGNLEEMLKDVNLPQEFSEGISRENGLHPTPQMKNGEIPKEFKWPNYSTRPVGYTPKEWNDERKVWRKDNNPLFESNKTKLKNNINDARDIKKLNQLNKSKKLPEGMGRAIINPETGDIRSIAQLAGLATPETQEWVKITSRFQNRAKDAFGSRVTNFDLQSYMKQFPGLLNTTEGRERILRMMTINNELDQSYEKALNKVYNKYGLSGIPPEEADRLAQEFIKDETERLENEYLNIDEQNQMQSQEPVKLSGQMVDVIGPDGQEYEVDQSEVEFLPQGFRLK